MRRGGEKGPLRTFAGRGVPGLHAGALGTGAVGLGEGMVARVCLGPRT